MRIRDIWCIVLILIILALILNCATYRSNVGEFRSSFGGIHVISDQDAGYDQDSYDACQDSADDEVCE